MIAALAAVVFAWSTLFATVYVARYRLGAPVAVARALVATCYMALAAAALSIIGLDHRGVLAASGMLVPTIAAVWWIEAR